MLKKKIDDFMQPAPVFFFFSLRTPVLTSHCLLIHLEKCVHEKISWLVLVANHIFVNLYLVTKTNITF